MMFNAKLKLLKNLTLLLVENDDMLLINLQNTLKVFFNTIFIAKDGKEAFEIYQSNSIDMIITDYVMPFMNGYELCKKIREIDKNIPLVIMSNYSDSEKLLNSISLNLTKYLLKPINFEKLTTTLLHMLDRLEYENKLFEYINESINYDRLKKQIIIDKNPIHLSKSEILLIELFLKYKNSLVSSEMIENRLDQNHNKSEKAIKNIIYRLRQKVGKEIIINVQSLGYMLKVE